MLAQISLNGFRNFEASSMRDGSVTFFGSVKIVDAMYCATIKVTLREDGSPKIGLGDYRFETMTGKKVRGAANTQLEELMSNAKEAALDWSRINISVFRTDQVSNRARTSDDSPSFDM